MQRAGSRKQIFRMALLPFGEAYSAALALRNAMFKVGIFPVARVGVPVIAVGNITAGGTGKTPLVELIVRMLQNLGKKVAVVSRGYGRRSHGVVVVSDGKSVLVDGSVGGDEPVQVARKFPGVPVVVGERRIDAVHRVVNELGAGVVVLDDAFQHRFIHRDLNILVLEAGKDIRDEWSLPAGLRREPLVGIRRADLVAWSGIKNHQRVADLRGQIARWFAGPMISYCVEPLPLRTVRGGVDKGSCVGKRVVAFCGIAAPQRFFATVRQIGGDTVREMVFPDHHRFTKQDVQRILLEFCTSHADLLVTTEKDATRMLAVEDLRCNFLESYPVWYLPVEVRIVEGEEQLTRMLLHALGGTEST